MIRSFTTTTAAAAAVNCKPYKASTCIHRHHYQSRWFYHNQYHQQNGRRQNNITVNTIVKNRSMMMTTSTTSRQNHHPQQRRLARRSHPPSSRPKQPKPKPMMNQTKNVVETSTSSPDIAEGDATSMNWPTIASILLLPVMMVGYVLSESITGNNQILKNETLRQKFLKQYGEDHSAIFSQKRPLCHCVVRKSYGFTHCMGPSLQVGDVVEVLDEFVGPDQDGQNQQNNYALCRFVPKGETESKRVEYVYGWFPIRWIQKLEDYQASVAKLHRQQQVLQQSQ